jgi:hypothetical protein
MVRQSSLSNDIMRNELSALATKREGSRAI